MMNALNILGLKIELESWDKVKKVPLYISNYFFIQKASINGIYCLSLTPYDVLPPLSSLKKQIASIQAIEDLPIYINLNEISYFRKQNLLQNNIPFILKDKMVFLPFMTTFLTNQKFEQNINVEKLTLSAQLLFIWILYQNENQYFINDALEVLDVSHMTLTRSYRQLVATTFFKEHKDGRKIYLTTSLSKDELFKKMRPYLQSPVKSQFYMMKDQRTQDMVLAGESTLSQYSFINPPQIEIYAIDKANSKDLHTQKELFDKEQQIEVQIWEYDPLLFSEDQKHIDKISLMTSFFNNHDERLDKELEQFLKDTFL